MRSLAAIKFEEKRSQFYAHLYSISHQDEINDVLTLHCAEYKKAAHHCYAVRVIGENGIFEDNRSDGEVGHPGRSLMEIVKRNKLESHMLIVSRIFGGVKLGPGGVSRAFKEAGNGVIELARENGSVPHDERIRD
jgi:putative IMPACT (imprinted ancient) family translation regulator